MKNKTTPGHWQRDEIRGGMGRASRQKPNTESRNWTQKAESGKYGLAAPAETPRQVGMIKVNQGQSSLIKVNQGQKIKDEAFRVNPEQRSSTTDGRG
jgi:hypothetical protein